MYYAASHRAGSNRLLFIAVGNPAAPMPWDQVIESACWPREHAERELRRLQDRCVQLNGGCMNLSAGQAAKLLGVHRVTVWRMYQAGRFPGATQTEGGHLRIPAGEVEAAKREREAS